MRYFYIIRKSLLHASCYVSNDIFYHCRDNTIKYVPESTQSSGDSNLSNGAIAGIIIAVVVSVVVVLVVLYLIYRAKNRYSSLNDEHETMNIPTYDDIYDKSKGKEPIDLEDIAMADGFKGDD